MILYIDKLTASDLHFCSHQVQEDLPHLHQVSSNYDHS